MSSIKEVSKRESAGRYSLLHKSIPVICLIMILSYYFPMYGVIWFLPDRLYRAGDLLYYYLNPFTTSPVIIGILCIFINLRYKECIIKIIFLLLLLWSIIITGFMVVNEVMIIEMYRYIPLVFVVGVNIKIISKCKKMKNIVLND